MANTHPHFKGPKANACEGGMAGMGWKFIDDFRIFKYGFNFRCELKPKVHVRWPLLNFMCDHHTIHRIPSIYRPPSTGEQSGNVSFECRRRRASGEEETVEMCPKTHDLLFLLEPWSSSCWLASIVDWTQYKRRTHGRAHHPVISIPRDDDSQ